MRFGIIGKIRMSEYVLMTQIVNGGQLGFAAFEDLDKVAPLKFK